MTDRPDRRPLALDDLYRIPFLADAQLSPDGSQVAFVVTRADRDADENRSQLWLVSTDASSSPRPLTAGPTDAGPRWSPDGSTIAFLGRRGDDTATQIYLLPMAGGEARRLTGAEGGVGEATWSPDGARLAFTSRVAPEGDEPNAPVVVRSLTHKSDGVGLLRDHRSHLFVTDLDGNVVQLTSGDRSVGRPCWSPDGGCLAYVAGADPGRDAVPVSDVCVVAAEPGATPRQLTDHAGTASTLTFAPDGDTIVYVGTARFEVGHAGLFSARVVDESASARPLIAGLDRNVMPGAPAYPGATPVVTSDGAILFCARDRGSTHIYRCDLDGDADEAVVKVVGSPSMSCTGLSLAGDVVAYVEADPATCGEVAIAAADGSGPRRLTSMVGEALAEVELAAPVARRFEAPDGTPIEGWLLSGRADHDAPPPLLLDIHGGPHNAWNPTFDGVHLYHQLLAAAGWNVLFVNPRGSDGYGEDFYRGLLKDGWGQADIGDLLGPLDALVAGGEADPNRLAVTGYSYGGFMTCRLTSHTERFAAAVAGGVVTNLVSFAGTSDLGPLLADKELGGTPWGSLEHLVTLSPTTSAAKVTTPTLILHGEADDRCPIGQAEEWFAAQRHRGQEVELVRYPGASHLFILLGRPSHRIDYCGRLVDWVQRLAVSR